MMAMSFLLLKLTSYAAKKKRLKVCKILQINIVLLILRKLTRIPAENGDPTFLLDATLAHSMGGFRCAILVWSNIKHLVIGNSVSQKC